MVLPPSDRVRSKPCGARFHRIAQLQAELPGPGRSACRGRRLDVVVQLQHTVASEGAGAGDGISSIVNFLTTYRMFGGVDFDKVPGGGWTTIRSPDLMARLRSPSKRFGPNWTILNSKPAGRTSSRSLRLPDTTRSPISTSRGWHPASTTST